MTLYPDIRVRKYQGGKPDWWEVTDRVKVRCALHPYGRFFIPYGYTSDFASVPQVFWWLVPPHGRTAPACVVHDYLYEHNPVKATRKEVDRFWLELLKQSGVPTWQVWTMYLYVRALGWYTWK
ncbi:DUF1353 domain-containing protein [Runella sp.]|uniref:DUF1353 domain-containing protein n=1 Tax=Runella sp. TaxID=1960881 RepID=UPI003D144C8F